MRPFFERSVNAKVCALKASASAVTQARKPASKAIFSDVAKDISSEKRSCSVVTADCSVAVASRPAGAALTASLSCSSQPVLAALLSKLLVTNPAIPHMSNVPELIPAGRVPVRIL